jgi:hypothetical protein
MVSDILRAIEIEELTVGIIQYDISYISTSEKILSYSNILRLMF